MLLSNQKKVSPDFFDGNLAGQHASHYGGTGIPEPVERLAASLLRADDVDGITGGCNPQHYNPESLASNRGAYEQGHPALFSTAHEDAAQTIGGRIPTAISPTGFTCKARPPATHQRLCPAEVSLLNAKEV